ncbi:choloylglycine hydrolase family protein [Clostridium sp. WILCCON 0269]|uniref:Choloylglycine hydrolase family protein n=1 Tax=Candidatus Clostridium eludens TaxID=3381663 RepID=A0ABW8SIK6_9CLOT
MCTSLTLETTNCEHLLGRTMDVSIKHNLSVDIIPRNYIWTNIAEKQEKKTKYAFIGTSVGSDGHPILADGLNEKGLLCAMLDLTVFTQYSKIIVEGKENIAPHDFVFWALSQFKDLEEAKKSLQNLEIVHMPPHLLNLPPHLLNLTPLVHYILSDKSGKSIVVERTPKGLQVFDNPVGVMTNSPNFQWHLNNLYQYIGIRSTPFDKVEWGNLELYPFTNGSGAFGLPGDFTSPSRFTRAAYLKNNLTQIDNELEGINGIFHILSNCQVPKGAVITSDGKEHSTVYTSAMCSESGTYYYYTYDNTQISAINLFNEDLNTVNIKSYPFRNNPIIHMEN